MPINQTFLIKSWLPIGKTFHEDLDDSKVRFESIGDVKHSSRNFRCWSDCGHFFCYEKDILFAGE
jgi:hypothetical protein